MTTVKKVKKAQKGVNATADSSAYYKNQEDIFNQLAKSEKGNTKVANFNREYFKGQAGKAVSDQLRQLRKGKPGYDANGNPLKKEKTGGKVTKAKDGKWIQKAIKKPGALRKSLGAKKGEPIPASKLAAAAKKPGKLGQRARLAQTLKKMKK